MFSDMTGQESVTGDRDRILNTNEETDGLVRTVVPTVPPAYGDLADQILNNGHGEVTESTEEAGQERTPGEGESDLSTKEEAEDGAPSAVGPDVPLGSGVTADQVPDIEAQVNRFLARAKIETDHREPQKIPFTEEMKNELRPILQEGLRIAAESNKESLMANIRRGEFLIKISDKLKEMKLRTFRAVCAALGWSKTSAYDWIKLYKSFGEHLTDYTTVPERNLIILASHPRAMELLDTHLDEIRDLDASDLREWVKKKHPRQVGEQRAKRVTKIELGPFLVTRRKDTTIKGLKDSDFEALIDFLKARAGQRTLKADGTSDASDTSAEITDFGEDTTEEAYSDTTIENARGQSATNSEDHEHLHVEEQELESQFSSQDASPNETGDYHASKPSQVYLIRTFADEREQADILMGDDIPDEEDWADYADDLWNQAAEERKPFERVRMEDPDGRIYLHELSY